MSEPMLTNLSSRAFETFRRLNWRFTIHRSYAYIPTLLIFGCSLWLLRAARGLPNNDYWTMIGDMLGEPPGTIDLGGLFAPSNEHFVVLAKIIYLLNLFVTSGDNYGLVIVTCIFAALGAGLIVRVFLKGRVSALEGAIFGIIAAVFCFPTMAAHNFFQGMSGVPWLGANLFALVSFACGFRAISATDVASRNWLFAAIGSAIVSSLFYSTGLAAGLALAFQFLTLRQTRRTGIAVAIVFLAYVYFISAIQIVPEHHADRQTDIIKLTTFSLTFLGSTFTTDVPLARAIGTLGAALFAVFAALQLKASLESKSSEPGASFWFALAGYGALNALIGAVGRSGMGGDAAALSSRYGTLPAFFWLGLIALGFHFASPLWRELSRTIPLTNQRLSSVAPLGVLLFGLIASFFALKGGMARVEGHLSRTSNTHLAALMVLNGVEDGPILRPAVTIMIPRLNALLPKLEAHGHVPFTNQYQNCPAPGQTIELAPRSSASSFGFVDSVTKSSDPDWYRISGWLAERSTHRPPRAFDLDRHDVPCIVVIDASDTVLGFAIGGYTRADVGIHFGTPHTDYGWNGFVQASNVNGLDKDASLRVAAIDQKSGTWIVVAEKTASIADIE